MLQGSIVGVETIILKLTRKHWSYDLQYQLLFSVLLQTAIENNLY